MSAAAPTPTASSIPHSDQLPVKTERGHRGGIVGVPSDARGGNPKLAEGIIGSMPSFFKGISKGEPGDLPTQDKRGSGGMSSDARQRNIDPEKEVDADTAQFLGKGQSCTDEQVGDKTQN
jgi:hypothetical protein